jgi:ribosome-associated protein
VTQTTSPHQPTPDREALPADIRRRVVIAAQAADAKKGLDTVILEVGPVLVITDAFVITSGTNPRQVRTIAEEVERWLTEQEGVKPRRIEGLNEATWVLLDYGEFVVHVFHEDSRRFYDLERLWSDVGRVDWEPATSSAVAS